MDSVNELKKAKARIMVEIIEYLPNSVLSKTSIRKITGNIMVSSSDCGEELAEKISPLDNYIQIIDGKVKVTIKDGSNHQWKGFYACQRRRYQYSGTCLSYF